jgi:hypothetical protein
MNRFSTNAIDVAFHIAFGAARLLNRMYWLFITTPYVYTILVTACIASAIGIVVMNKPAVWMLYPITGLLCCSAPFLFAHAVLAKSRDFWKRRAKTIIRLYIEQSHIFDQNPELTREAFREDVERYHVTEQESEEDEISYFLRVRDIAWMTRKHRGKLTLYMNTKMIQALHDLIDPDEPGDLIDWRRPYPSD